MVPFEQGTILHESDASLSATVSPVSPIAKIFATIPSNVGSIAALDSKHGTIVWKYPATEARSPITHLWTAQDAVFFERETDDALYSLTSADGKENWLHPIRFQDSSIVAADPTTLYVETASNRPVTLSAVNRRDGTLRWRQIFDASYFVPLLVNNGSVYVQSGGYTYRCALTDGTVEWKIKTSSPGTFSNYNGTLALSQGTLVIGGDDYTVAGVSAQNGARLWKYHGTEPIRQLIATDTMVYAFTTRGAILAFDV